MSDHTEQLRQVLLERAEVRDAALRAELYALRAELDMAAALRNALREQLDGPELTDKQIIDEVRYGVRACELLHHIREIAAIVDRLGGPAIDPQLIRGLEERPDDGLTDYERGWRDGYGKGRDDEANNAPLRSSPGEVATR